MMYTPYVFKFRLCEIDEENSRFNLLMEEREVKIKSHVAASFIIGYLSNVVDLQAIGVYIYNVQIARDQYDRKHFVHQINPMEGNDNIELIDKFIRDVISAALSIESFMEAHTYDELKDFLFETKREFVLESLSDLSEQPIDIQTHRMLLDKPLDGFDPKIIFREGANLLRERFSEDKRFVIANLSVTAEIKLLEKNERFYFIYEFQMLIQASRYIEAELHQFYEDYFKDFAETFLVKAN